MVRLLILLITFCFSSCTGIKTIVPHGGDTKIPLKEDFFEKHYRQKYTIETPEELDYNAIYVKAYYVDKTINSIASVPSDYALKFYKNGCVSRFYIGNIAPENLLNLNPEFKGARGMAYKKKGKYFMDLIVPINERYIIGKSPYEITIKNDSLILKRVRSNSTTIYLKKPLSDENKVYKANW